jgi:regulator of sirC expression with transglutaminase-like and TPR domain
VREALTILAGPAPVGRLDRAALEVASIEHPGLDPERWLAVLDGHAAALSRRVTPAAPAARFLDAANQYLFGELGFTGNAGNYYDPRNSCLNDVLASRTGLPITLSIVYMEVARRLGRQVQGVGLPGHFLVRCDEGESTIFLDPFHGGVRRTPNECYALARQASGVSIPGNPSMLAPVTHRQIVLRMLNNLRTVYLNRHNYRRALRVFDFLLQAYPDSPDLYKQRAAVHSRLEDLSAARADYQRCLELAPEASDRSETEQRLQSVQQRLASLN